MKSRRLRRLVLCTGCAYSSKLECSSFPLGGKIGYGLRVSRLGDKQRETGSLFCSEGKKDQTRQTPCFVGSRLTLVSCGEGTDKAVRVLTRLDPREGCRKSGYLMRYWRKKEGTCEQWLHGGWFLAEVQSLTEMKVGVLRTGWSTGCGTFQKLGGWLQHKYEWLEKTRTLAVVPTLNLARVGEKR